MSCRNSFRNNRTFCILPDMDHFGSGISLLEIIGKRHGVKFRNRIITKKNATWIFPGNCGTGFNLVPVYF